MKMSYYLSNLKKTKREYFESLSWNAFRGGAGGYSCLLCL